MTSAFITGLELLPFATTLILYFVLFIPSDEASVYAAVIKCLPILSLNVFIYLHGFGTKDDHTFRKRIFYGLLFSCLGDLFLVWPNLFVPGMIAFGVAHIFYIMAFGFKPINMSTGIILYAFATVMDFVLMPGLDGVLKYGVPIYSYLLVTMTWRTIARIPQSKITTSNWNEYLTGIGGISWTMSDGFLGFSHFYSPLPYSQVLIMVTYYIGQLGIALSILGMQKSSKLS